ncbi:unnamed protein product [Echinostoma caproni]|uniref:Abhydrolase_3 domain-containing protein n=1 Tax=Echinostoma caproni TaxID=27848 RepID=A0A183A1R0_9TREM|nr:unnamed protein product [Echinostoma caproni]
MGDQEFSQMPTFDMEMDIQYDPEKWLTRGQIPEGENKRWVRRLREQSDLCRQQAKLHNGVDLAVPYGEITKDQKGTEAFDWFAPFRIPDKIQHVIVYIHGGYWKALDLPESSHWATAVTDFGAIFVGLAYRLAPWQSIQTMPQRICQGLQTVFEHSKKRIAEKIKSKPNMHMHLVGHSAGAQMVIESIVKATQLPTDQQEWLHSVHSLILISGVYDLRPLIQTSMNQYLKFDSVEQAWEVSPLRLFAESNMINQIPASIRWLIAWAQYDSPAFIEQSRQLIDFMRSKCGHGKNQSDCCDGRVSIFCISDEDHFSSIEKLHEGMKGSSMFKKLFEFIRVKC